VGEKVRLRVTLPGHELPFALDGVVRWVEVHDNAEQRPAGMGIEFVEFSGDVKDQILAFVHSVEGEDVGENPELS
jgi:Tfp pilus assembly protein PilZ